MKFFKAVEKAIVYLNISVIVLSLSLMVVLGFLQVILRNFFNAGFTWADIVIRSLVLWVGFSGAVVAVAKGRYIAIPVLVKFLPEGGRRMAHVLTSIFTSVVCLFLVYSSIRFVGSEIQSGALLFEGVPLWVSEIIIPFTFGCLAYQFLLYAFEPSHTTEGGEI